jgi:hypothetical protein
MNPPQVDGVWTIGRTGKMIPAVKVEPSLALAILPPQDFDAAFSKICCIGEATREGS